MSDTRLAELKEYSARRAHISAVAPLEELLAEVDRLREQARDYRARMMGVGALICEPVSSKNLREAKAYLETAYHDALADLKQSRTASSSSNRNENATARTVGVQAASEGEQ